VNVFECTDSKRVGSVAYEYAAPAIVPACRSHDQVDSLNRGRCGRAVSMR
jgi:hypothetical protein